MELPEHRSPSQYDQYNRCPYSYKLARIDGAWQRPAAWLPQGTGVHSAVEAIERSGRALSLHEALEVYYASYDDEVDTYAEVVPIDYWFASGPHKPDQDIPRRRELGAAQIGRYLDFVAEHPEQGVWVNPEGEPIIEYKAEYYLGNVLIRGMLDLAIDHPELGVIVRDVKSGNTPGGIMQLLVYAAFLRQKFGIKVNFGDYWMGRAGQPTVPYKLTELTEDYLVNEFGKLDELIRAGEFEPDPEPSKCYFCSVRPSCIFAA